MKKIKPVTKATKSTKKSDTKVDVKITQEPMIHTTNKHINAIINETTKNNDIINSITNEIPLNTNTNTQLPDSDILFKQPIIENTFADFYHNKTGRVMGNKDIIHRGMMTSHSTNGELVPVTSMTGNPVDTGVNIPSMGGAIHCVGDKMTLPEPSLWKVTNTKLKTPLRTLKSVYNILVFDETNNVLSKLLKLSIEYIESTTKNTCNNKFDEKSMIKTLSILKTTNALSDGYVYINADIGIISNVLSKTLTSIEAILQPKGEKATTCEDKESIKLSKPPELSHILTLDEMLSSISNMSKM